MQTLSLSLKTLGLTALMLLLVGPSSAWAQTENSYLVHGIPGGDIGLSDALPVDIAVDGACAIDDFSYGDVVGPVPFAAGPTDIEIFLSDGVDGTCEGTQVIDLPGVLFADGMTSTIVAHLTQDGTAGAGDVLGVGITASKFGLDLNAPDRGKGVLVAHHTALAPDVDVDLTRGRARTVTVEDFAWGTQLPAPLRPGNWRLQLRVADTDIVAYGPEKVRIKPYQAFVVFAVGTGLTDSFDVIGFRVPTALK